MSLIKMRTKNAVILKEPRNIARSAGLPLSCGWRNQGRQVSSFYNRSLLWGIFIGNVPSAVGVGFVVFRELAACISCLLHKIRNGIDIFPDVFSDDLSTAMCTNVTQDLLVIFLDWEYRLIWVSQPIQIHRFGKEYSCHLSNNQTYLNMAAFNVKALATLVTVHIQILFLYGIIFPNITLYLFLYFVKCI